MNAIIRKSLPAAITASLVAGAFAIPAIAATDGTTSDDTTAAAEEHERGRHGGLLGRGLEDGEAAERLAAELGLDTETVQAAIDAVKSDLAAERLVEQVESGRLTQEQADRIAEAVADGDREAAREVFDEVRLEHLTDRLAERVEEGELTQEEADEILTRAEEGDFPGRRGPRGHRGPGSPGGPAGDTAPQADGASV